MLVEAHVALPLGVTAAGEALHHALSDGSLAATTAPAAEADTDASFLMRVGPRAPGRLTKQVLVHTSPAHVVGSTTVIPLRWEPTGHTGRLFPLMDAKLGLTAANETGSLLSIVARYEPPLGRLGTELDHAAMAKAAAATAEALLREIARRVSKAAARPTRHP